MNCLSERASRSFAVNRRTTLLPFLEARCAIVPGRSSSGSISGNRDSVISLLLYNPFVRRSRPIRRRFDGSPLRAICMLAAEGGSGQLGVESGRRLGGFCHVNCSSSNYRRRLPHFGRVALSSSGFALMCVCPIELKAPASHRVCQVWENTESCSTEPWPTPDCIQTAGVTGSILVPPAYPAMGTGVQ